MTKIRRRYCKECGNPLRLRYIAASGNGTFDERTGKRRRYWVLICAEAIDTNYKSMTAGIAEAASWHTVRVLYPWQRWSGARRRLARKAV